MLKKGSPYQCQEKFIPAVDGRNEAMHESHCRSG